MTAITHQQPTRFQRNLFIVMCVFSVVFLWMWYQYLVNNRLYGESSSPDFAAISNIDARKQSFIHFLYPLITKQNHTILQERKKLIAVEHRLQNTGHLSIDQSLWLERLAGQYAVSYAANDQQGVIKQLLPRVNIIPPSLVLAQAANESAWGVSRFATDANNYFGQWCYQKGCGLVPTNRDRGLSHEVKSFPSVADSVKSYFDILNSGKAFEQLRVLRQQLQEKQKPVTGLELAAGLSKYSEMGEKYIGIIRTIIEANNLQDYTKAFQVSLGDRYSDLIF